MQRLQMLNKRYASFIVRWWTEDVKRFSNGLKAQKVVRPYRLRLPYEVYGVEYHCF